MKFNDGTIYIKYSNNDSFLQYDNIVRADGYLWNADTNKADKLASYGDEDLEHRYSEFYAESCIYAYVDVTGGSYDDIAGYEEYMGFNEVRFRELDNELNIISEIFDVEKPTFLFLIFYETFSSKSSLQSFPFIKILLCSYL